LLIFFRFFVVLFAFWIATIAAASVPICRKPTRGPSSRFSSLQRARSLLRSRLRLLPS
jgi:hypothetical protein